MAAARVNALRRWFQFRISTWFVLVALLAWAMLEWPWRTIQIKTTILKYDGSGRPSSWVEEAFWQVNQDLIYPVLALAAFVCWKATRQIVERRSGRVAV